MSNFKLKAGLRSTATANGDDVLSMKHALNQLGDYDPPSYGMTPYPDTPMFDGMKAFQKRNGLTVDGFARPGGPTETLIKTNLARKKLGLHPGVKVDSFSDRDRSGHPKVWFKTALPENTKGWGRDGNQEGSPQKIIQRGDGLDPVLRIGEGVGLGQVNRPRDVVSLKNALALAGHYPVAKAQQQIATPDDDLLWGLMDFQRAHGLITDGHSRPGGATESRLNDLVSPQIQLASVNTAGANTAGLRTAAPSQGLPQGMSQGMPHSMQPDTSLTQTLGAEADQPDQPPPTQLAQAQGTPAGNAPTPNQPPPSLPPMPTYTDSSGGTSTRVTQSDWRRIHQAMDAIGITDPVEREVYGRIYSAEGGGKSDGTTVAGITADILTKIHDPQSDMDWAAQRLTAAGVKPGMTPDQLSPEQQMEVYKVYLDTNIGPAKASEGKVGAFDVLNKGVGDKHTVAAIADTVFREGGPKGTDLIQEAINKTFADTGRSEKVKEDGILGSGSLSAIRSFMNSKANRKLFIDNLMDGRSAFRANKPNFKGEKMRIDSYRLP